jgi:hypothetical protein
VKLGRQNIIEPLKMAGKSKPIDPSVVTAPQAIEPTGKLLDIQPMDVNLPLIPPVVKTASSRLTAPKAKPDTSEKYWVQNYNTTLDADNEKRFQVWFGQQTKDVQSYRNRALYDLRGYWLNGGHKDKTIKIPDAYKKPERPTQ